MTRKNADLALLMKKRVEQTSVGIIRLGIILDAIYRTKQGMIISTVFLRRTYVTAGKEKGAYPFGVGQSDIL
jgi:hypothetical protein